MTLKVLWNVTKRVALEFIPPTLIGLGWLYLNWEPKKPILDLVAHFTAAFFAASWVWANLLRIHHQQTQKAQQSEIAGGVQGVDKQVRTLGDDLTIVKGTLASLVPKIDALLPTLPKKEADEITSLVNTANAHIASANSTYEAVSYRLKAEPGRYKVTSGSG